LEAEIDADLKLIIERWADLSSELRTAIVKMVRQNGSLFERGMR
jgi:hypothetical protein